MAPLKLPKQTYLLLVLAAVLSAEISFLACPAAAAGKTGQITVFWGRHSDEGTLREACDFHGVYTTVIMSSLNVYGHGKYRLDLSGHPLAGVGGDIRHCQSLGIPVFLSIGGAYGLPTNRSALDLADHLWYSYLSGDREDVPRPFGDARIDGIDFFLEPDGVGGVGSGEEHYDALARELAKRNNKRRAVGGKTPPALRLTATPRCAFPPDGRGVGRALATGLFERIHVRFYDYPNWDRDAGGAEGGELRRGHALGPIQRRAERQPVQRLRQELGLSERASSGGPCLCSSVMIPSLSFDRTLSSAFVVLASVWFLMSGSTY